MTNFVLSPTKSRSQSTKTAPNVLSTDPPTKISEIAREQNEDRKLKQPTVHVKFQKSRKRNQQKFQKLRESKTKTENYNNPPFTSKFRN